MTPDWQEGSDTLSVYVYPDCELGRDVGKGGGKATSSSLGPGSELEDYADDVDYGAHAVTRIIERDEDGLHVCLGEVRAVDSTLLDGFELSHESYTEFNPNPAGRLQSVTLLNERHPLASAANESTAGRAGLSLVARAGGHQSAREIAR